ncbi:MAG: OmpA family protein [Lunatimonas sp.]|uniref:OmpA family protein n=1 Tax=Lunatimonas sp. TaxID=2060141 RepID=UPI00263AE3FA|nr:OmpA family protein [Lunatimonas sp.]MCC5938373.1 OmpA family protein [Lunatimonas sp.]
MKTLFIHYLVLFISIGASCRAFACDRHPLFNHLPNHKVSFCEENAFNRLKVKMTSSDGSLEDVTKSGYFIDSWFEFQGEFEKRPSAAEIIENYKNAVISKGGSALYESRGEVYLSVKVSGQTWWTRVSSDNSGTYRVESVREEAMDQSIILSAEEIKQELLDAGRAIFYGILFDSDKAEIKQESSETLEEIARFLLANPSVNVYVVGHTDNTGTFAHNLDLSKKRATAVVDHLTKKAGIPTHQLEAIGVGPVSPISHNRTDAEKQKNRRVELVVK